ncbi:MAG: hypothetical protein A2045_15190 [Rhodocyclales bacterium GWA2_65_20]|nr:MAG: hypothetical protein A2045_15190 [Rhodocyclales bacterium GWA2_65_20]
MPTDFLAVTSVAVPAESEAFRAYESTDLADAYSIRIPVGSTTNPEQLASFIFSGQAPWVSRLMKFRDLLVARFGLKTSDQLAKIDPTSKARRIGFFRIYSTTENEIVLGEDDSHLDFRLSVLCTASSSTPAQHRLTLSTVVHCHNRLGRTYIFLIAPFHRAVVRSSLRRAARRGWPKAANG